MNSSLAVYLVVVFISVPAIAYFSYRRCIKKINKSSTMSNDESIAKFITLGNQINGHRISGKDKKEVKRMINNVFKELKERN